MELVEGGELFDHIVQMGAFTESVARYASWSDLAFTLASGGEDETSGTLDMVHA